MGDVFQWFRPGDGTWGQRAHNAHEKVEGWLNVAGLPSGLSQDELKAHFKRFYSTVKQVKMIKQGSAQVLFGFVAERDKALGEMQGQALKGCPLMLSKYSPAEPVQIAPMRKRGRGGISDDEIQKFLLDREVRRTGHAHLLPGHVHVLFCNPVPCLTCSAYGP